MLNCMNHLDRFINKINKLNKLYIVSTPPLKKCNVDFKAPSRTRPNRASGPQFGPSALIGAPYYLFPSTYSKY